ncbi:MAG: hypothetical protein GX422_05705 [Deltaproteobacteria bacterium]|nr:hypothetical protein [Deltaproteobacteria bacterium]
MKWGLRLGGIGMILVGAVLAAMYFSSGAKAPEGDLSHKIHVKEKVITGVYKTYGVKDAPVPMWLAKSVFQNNMNGRITNLRVRYKVTDYADWSSWHNYAAVDPTQTVVDVYYPIFSSACARLTSRAPTELQMECEYVDPAGQKRQTSETRPLTMLSRHEFIFSDLTAEERTASFQDMVTYAELLAAWVSRSDDIVARLASMANKRAGGLGASSSDENCIKVMAALYDIMRIIHISYQHPPALVDKKLSYDLKLVQSLQYPRDTIQKRSGTCIDLAILYAAMLNSINIDPYLVVIDGHCFPMAKTPSGKFIPVEATGVGDGYAKGMDFEQAVKSGLESWEKVNQTGRFVLVDVRQTWMEGVANPELDTMPPDILEKWGIVALVESPGGTEAPPVGYASVQQPGGYTPTPATINGRWTYTLTAMDGRNLSGQIEISSKGGQLRMVATASYQMMGQDGRYHQFQERNNFVGSIDGQTLVARCDNAVYTMDGRRVPPQGLPLQLSLEVAPDGRSMEGHVANSLGAMAPIILQKQ